MSRPHSPFKLSSRPNSRSSPSRPLAPPSAAPLSSHSRSTSRSKWILGLVPGASSAGAGVGGSSTNKESTGPPIATRSTAPIATRRGPTASSNGVPAPSPSARASSPYHHHHHHQQHAHTRTTAPPPAPSSLYSHAAQAARGDYVTRAEHYDVVLERGEYEDGEEFEAQTILPYLGHGIVDQTGRLEGTEPDPRSPSVPWQSSPLDLGTTSISPSPSSSYMPKSNSAGSITAVKRPFNSDRHDDPSFPGSSHYSAFRNEAEQKREGEEKGEREKEEKFRSALMELLSTERSYVKRIEALHHRYANPLRQLARDKDTAIIPLYEAQRLFGNIGEILGANSAFLIDLEEVVGEIAGAGDAPVGSLNGRNGQRLGEVVYRHLACFHCYNEYLSNIEKAKHVEQTMTKSNRSFREFVDRTKYSTQGLGNIGLRELLMEPVQRIPRYTLLLDLLLKNLPRSLEGMRKRLVEANGLAAKIASREVDEQTKRAAVLWSLSRCVEGFPAGLISVHRQFIDCVDVEDFPMDVFGASLFSPSSSISAGTSGVHHCTLFLFDDRLVVCKRASSTASGRRIIGLDDLNRLADLMKTCTERSGKVEGGGGSKELGFRGMIDINDVRARDLGAADFQLFFSTSLSHVTSDKWAHRPVRQYATHDSYLHSGAASGAIGSSTTTTSSYAFGFSHSSSSSSPAGGESAYQGASGPLEKVRFLENLWRAQALGKTKERRSQVRCQTFEAAPMQGEEAKVRRVVFWNVYNNRRSYLVEPRKSPVVLHVDPLRQADDVPLGHDLAPPHASLRLHSVDEEYAECSYSIYVKGTHGSSEQHLLPLADLSTRLSTLANDMSSQYEDDFAPNRSRASPSTPASHRGRVVQGLESFSRNLFGVGGGGGGGGTSTPGSFRSAAGSDMFGSPRRNRSGASKTSSSAAAAAMSNTLSRKGSSSAHTYSTMQTSVASRDMLFNNSTATSSAKLSPESAWHNAYLAQGPASGAGAALQRRRSQSQSQGRPSNSSGRRSSVRAATPDLFERHRRALSLDPSNANQDVGVDSDASPIRCGSAMGDSTARYDDSVDVTLAPPPPPPKGHSSPSGTGSLRQRTRSTPSKVASRPPSSNGGRITPLGPSRGPTSNRHHPDDEASPSPSPIRRKPPPKEYSNPADDGVEQQVGFGIGAGQGREGDFNPDSNPSPPVRRRANGYGSASKRGPPSDAPQGASQSAKRHTSFGSERRWGAASHDAQPGEVDHHFGREEKVRTTLADSDADAGVDAGEEGGAEEDEWSALEKDLQLINARGSERVERREATKRIQQRLERMKKRMEEGANARGRRERVDEDGAAENKGDSASTSTSTSTSTSDSGAEDSKTNNLQSSLVALQAEVEDLRPLQGKLKALERKCELLTTLEEDGRRENEILHKAFNEELDALYEQTQLPPTQAEGGSQGESEAVKALRSEVKRTKAQRNEVWLKNKNLQRELALERAQREVYQKMLEEKGLL